jgi:eukaryotic translation initiation factor 2C
MVKDLAPLVPPLTCVMGLDVCHGATSDDAEHSVATLVASLNSEFNLYTSDSVFQTKRQEIVNEDDMQTMLLNVKVTRNSSSVFLTLVLSLFILWQCLDDFVKQNGRGPQHILFYRDGVGEGFFERVFSQLSSSSSSSPCSCFQQTKDSFSLILTTTGLCSNRSNERKRWASDES